MTRISTKAVPGDVSPKDRADLLCRVGLARHHDMSTDALVQAMLEWMLLAGYRKSAPVKPERDQLDALCHGKAGALVGALDNIPKDKHIACARGFLRGFADALLSAPIWPGAGKEATTASDEPLAELLKRTIEAVKNMTPEERAAMWDAQRESWVRGEMAIGLENGHD